MNNSEHYLTEFEESLGEVVAFILSIFVLTFNICVLMTMWQHENVLTPMRRVCVIQAVVFTLLGFITIHDSFNVVIGHYLTNLTFCHFRVITANFFVIMMQWCTLMMVVCSLSLAHDSGPFLQLFFSAKHLFAVVVGAACIVGVATSLMFTSGTSERLTTCSNTIRYSPQIMAGTEGGLFFLTASLCCVRTYRQCRESRAVSPDVSDEDVRNKEFALASDTLFIYSVVFVLCSVPAIICTIYASVDGTKTTAWAQMQIVSGILQMLSAVALFPICLFRHRPVQENFHDMVCVKCMKFSSWFDENYHDSYSQAAYGRQSLADSHRRFTIHEPLHTPRNPRMSTTVTAQHTSQQRLQANDGAGSSVDSPSVVPNVTV